MPSYRPEVANKERRRAKSRVNFSCHSWLCAALVATLPLALACWCMLVFPGPSTLVKSILVSAVSGDARYWTSGQWRADVITLNAARHWMFDPEPVAEFVEKPTAPAVLVGTNSGSLKPTV
jgi:hypothetical protein